MSQQLLELADRCEKATGPDRELDLAIVNAVTTKAGWFWYDDLHSLISRNDYGQGAIENPICSLDPCTSFFDHAAALIPDGLYWHLGYGRTRDDEPLGGASIIKPGTLETIAEGEAVTPALALCAAALRARASALPPAQTLREGS